jgi:hypothetical protein
MKIKKKIINKKKKKKNELSIPKKIFEKFRSIK